MGDAAREQELLGMALRRVTDMKRCAAWQGHVALTQSAGLPRQGALSAIACCASAHAVTFIKIYVCRPQARGALLQCHTSAAAAAAAAAAERSRFAGWARL